MKLFVCSRVLRPSLRIVWRSGYKTYNIIKQHYTLVHCWFIGLNLTLFRSLYTSEFMFLISIHRTKHSPSMIRFVLTSCCPKSPLISPWKSHLSRTWRRQRIRVLRIPVLSDTECRYGWRQRGPYPHKSKVKQNLGFRSSAPRFCIGLPSSLLCIFVIDVTNRFCGEIVVIDFLTQLIIQFELVRMKGGEIQIR